MQPSPPIQNTPPPSTVALLRNHHPFIDELFDRKDLTVGAKMAGMLLRNLTDERGSVEVDIEFLCDKLGSNSDAILSFLRELVRGRVISLRSVPFIDHPRYYCTFLD